MDLNELIRQVTEEVCTRITSSGQAPSADDYAPSSLAKYIDHTLLKPDASEDQIRKVCDEAKKHQFASVCVNPSYIKLVAEQLAGSGVAPCVVVGFPLGATTPEVKADETNTVVLNGAKEVDMVINVGAVKSGNWALVKRDIEAVVGAAKGRALVKVIIETCLLTDEEKVKACTVSKLAGADFVKTSTGFSTGGATVEDVRLMRQTVGPVMGVKASGGVKDYNSAVAMIKAGATRLGTSSGAVIVSGAAEKSNCIACGRCQTTCPTGNVTITKSQY
jgi:deoxyribose-phosphate aldolase